MSKQELLNLNQIRIDGKTQQRKISKDVLARYTELVQDGMEFPPIEAIFDGKVYWLWDGFHRFFAYKNNERNYISANVSNSTRRDAVWLSFSANKSHGFPRQKGVAKEIIEKILCDDEWSENTETQIANHIGVTKVYVSQVKKGLSTLPLSRAKKVKVQSKTGKTYYQTSQETEHKKPQNTEKLKDKAGQEIPENLINRYLGFSFIDGYVKNVQNLKREFLALIENKDERLDLLHKTKFQSDCDNLIQTLKSSQPYAVCPYCGGDGIDCRACKGLGLLTKDQYTAVPEELK